MDRRSGLFKVCLLVLAVSLVVGAIILFLNLRTNRRPLEILVNPPAPTAVPQIKVYVSGAVNAQGVYVLPPNSRVEDAIAAAGGFSAEASPGAINLAQRLRDTDWINVPRPGEKPVVAPTATGPTVVNINVAGADELVSSLEGTGVGPAKARAIVDYRSVNGPFSRPEDVIKVPGIGVAIFAKIKDLIVLE